MIDYVIIQFISFYVSLCHHCFISWHFLTIQHSRWSSWSVMLRQQTRGTTLIAITFWIRWTPWTAWTPRTSTVHWTPCASPARPIIPWPCAAHLMTSRSWPLWPQDHCLLPRRRRWTPWRLDPWWGWGWGIHTRDTHTIARIVIRTCHTHTSPHTHTPPHVYNCSKILAHTRK